MSFALDANVLLHASDTASPHHQRAREFLRRSAAGSEVMCLAWPTVMAYLRISTHASIFADPLSPDEAVKNIEELLGVPHLRVLAEEEGFWEAYRQVTSGLSVRGNLVPDAHLAALLRLHGVDTLYTEDADFRRFKFLEVRSPLG